MKITQKFAHPQLANPEPNLIRNPEQIFYVMRKATWAPEVNPSTARLKRLIELTIQASYMFMLQAGKDYYYYFWTYFFIWTVLML